MSQKQMDDNAKITVTSLRPTTREGPLLAYANLRIGDWEIYDWRIVKPNNQPTSVQVPQLIWTNESGQRRYKAMIFLPAETKRRCETAILSAWEKEKFNGTNQNPLK